MKGSLYPEYVLATLAARLTGRPVKWIAERSEALQSDEHCRDNITDAELALDRDGRFLGLSVRTLATSAPITPPTAPPDRRPTISACSPAPM